MKSVSAWFALPLALSGVLSLGCSSDDKEKSSGDSTGGMSSGGATGDTTERTFNYDHEYLQYSGRIQFAADTPPKFSSPAVSVTARFKGVAVSAKLTDYAGTANFFDVVIDGDYDNSVKVQPASGATVLAKDLPYGEHTLTLVKRTEASTGQVAFRSLIVSGDLLPPPDRPTRRIEVIGDSISVGSGNEAANNSSECNEDYGRPYSNANKAYGPVLARKLQAEVHVTAVSGIGVLRNYNCSDTDTMPKVYDRVFLERKDSPDWDRTQFQPDALLILLGTNDFSPDSCSNVALNETVDPDNYTAFISTFEDFVTKLRGYYPDAQVFLAASPMLHDAWPDDTYTSDTSQRAAITTVADDLNADGQNKVHTLLANYADTRITGRGCGTHPNDFEHGIMAGLDSQRPNDPVPPSLMLDPIKEVMGW